MPAAMRSALPHGYANRNHPRYSRANEVPPRSLREFVIAALGVSGTNTAV